MFKTLRRQFEKERLGDACHLDDEDGMEVEGTVRPWRRGYEASASARCAPVGMQAHHHQLFTLSFDSISNLRYAYPAPRVIKIGVCEATFRLRRTPLYLSSGKCGYKDFYTYPDLLSTLSSSSDSRSCLTLPVRFRPLPPGLNHTMALRARRVFTMSACNTPWPSDML